MTESAPENFWRRSAAHGAWPGQHGRAAAARSKSKGPESANRGEEMAVWRECQARYPGAVGGQEGRVYLFDLALRARLGCWQLVTFPPRRTRRGWKPLLLPRTVFRWPPAVARTCGFGRPAPANHSPVVGRDCHIISPVALWQLERVHFLACGVPERHGAVRAPRCHQLAVRRDSRGVYRAAVSARMRRQCGNDLARRRRLSPDSGRAGRRKARMACASPDMQRDSARTLLLKVRVSLALDAVERGDVGGREEQVVAAHRAAEVLPGWVDHVVGRLDLVGRLAAGPTEEQAVPLARTG